MQEACGCGSGLRRSRCCGLDAASLPPAGVDRHLLPLLQQAVQARQAGDDTTAERLCLDVLELSPGQPDTLWMLSRLRDQQGRADAAEALVRRLVQLTPNAVAATHDLALRLLRRGAIADAEVHARNAVRIAPSDPQSHNLLGMVLTEAHQPVAGEFHYRRVLALRESRDAILLANLAWCLKLQGRIAEARALYEESIEAAPGMFQTLLGWARLEEADRNLSRAAALVEQAELLMPDHPSLALLRAVLHARSGKTAEALSVLDRLASERAERMRAATGVAGENAGPGASLTGDGAAAPTAGPAAVLEADPGTALPADVGAALPAGTVATLEADADGALRADAHAALNADADAALNADAVAALKADADAALKADAVAALKADADAAFTPEELLEKGRLLDRIGSCDAAFAAFEAAKGRLRALTGLSYRAEHAQQLAGRLRGFFTAERLATLPRAGIAAGGPQPLFILGFPRSGTTLVEQTLTAHPMIDAGDELPFIAGLTELMPRLLGSPLAYPEALSELWMGDRREGLDELRDHYLLRVRQRGILTPGVPFFTDKMPLNEFHLGLIALLFPAAPLIHVIRHPLDIVLSVFSNQLTHGFYCAYALESAARHYALVAELIAHYRTEMALRYLPVRYETLVGDQERQVRRMLEFVGLPFDAACLRFHENRRYARTASYAQVTEPLYDRSRERWRRYRRQLEPVIPILMPAIERLGYSVE